MNTEVSAHGLNGFKARFWLGSCEWLIKPKRGSVGIIVYGSIIFIIITITINLKSQLERRPL